MRITSATLEYLFKLERGKRFVLLFLFSLPFGAALASAAPSKNYVIWVKNYEVGNYNFLDQWNFGVGTFGKLFALLGVFVAFLMFSAIVVSMVARSLRVGKFRLAPLQDFNDNFFPMLHAAVVFLAAYLVYKVLTSLLLVLFQLISVKWLSLLLSIVSILLVLMVLLQFMAHAMLYIPLMVFRGFTSQNALLTSFRLTSKYAGKIFLTLLLALVLKTLLGCAISLAEIPLLSHLTDVVLNTFLHTFFVVYSLLGFYAVEDIKRIDYPREYFYAKGPKTKR